MKLVFLERFSAAYEVGKNKKGRTKKNYFTVSHAMVGELVEVPKEVFPVVKRRGKFMTEEDWRAKNKQMKGQEDGGKEKGGEGQEEEES